MPTIVVLIPTFKRPKMLARCLASIAQQDLLSKADLKVIVVVGDNNPNASASTQVAKIAKGFPCDLLSIHVVKPGLCENRNALFKKAVALCADFVALIDDDEWADPSWLSSFYSGQEKTQADVLIGPVRTEFHPDTPEWFVLSGIGQTNERHSLLTTGQPSPKLATSNAFLKGEILTTLETLWFPLELNFIGSEDQSFFAVAKAKGFERILWCAEAFVTEEMPLERSDFKYLVSRSLQRGASSVAAARVTNRLVSVNEASSPLAVSVRQLLRLVIGLPLLFVRKKRPRVIRHAIYVFGRFQGHFSRHQNFYGN